DESTEIKRKMELMHLYNWDRKSHGFCDGYADIQEDSDGMYVKILVPGLGKEDIKQVLVEQKLVGVDESPSVSRTMKMTMRVKVLRGGIIKNYTRPFFVEPENYKFSHVWAEVYHGVVRIFIPKLKPAKIEDGTFDVNLE
ncbi:hypothetical protein MKW92_013979, partial [Papaver armeniacum]